MQLFAGIMSAYGSFAPATTNVWADNSYICYINCFTSVMAGFAVSSMLGNMAWRQRSIAGGNADLRVNICTSYVGGTSQDMMCPESCDMCGQPDWRDLQYSACCGDYQVDNVAQGGIMLAFAVRRCAPNPMPHTPLASRTEYMTCSGAYRCIRWHFSSSPAAQQTS